MCPLISELKKRNEFEVKTVVTGQHKVMLDEVLSDFCVVPDFDLSIMKIGQTLSDITASVLDAIQPIMEKVMPDIVLVHGDTATAFSAALSAFYMKIPIGHIEAGLRTYNMENPYPEEFYRRAIALMASIHFAPTEMSEKNLVSEGVRKESVYVTGNTVTDALRISLSDGDFSEFSNIKERIIILTTHRRENIGTPMRNIFRAVSKLLRDIDDIRVFYPIHENPLIKKIVGEELRNFERIEILPPISVKRFHKLLKKTCVILTDSGGIQEEAVFLGKPVIVMRKDTERKEMLSNGCINLVGIEENDIYEAAKKLLLDGELYEKAAQPSNVYGDGFVSKKIADILART